jgi:hypothetical protein
MANVGVGISHFWFQPTNDNFKLTIWPFELTYGTKMVLFKR